VKDKTWSLIFSSPRKKKMAKTISASTKILIQYNKPSKKYSSRDQIPLNKNL
jgi:hypothetical protein